MEFAFLDESGDRGIKGSKYLVTTLICTSKCQEISKIIRNAKQRLLQKSKTARWLSRNGGEIKFYGFPDDALLRTILRKLSKLDIKTYALVFDKDKDVSNHSKVFLLSQLFEHIFKLSGGRMPEKILADRAFYGKEKIYRFLLNEYITKTKALKNADGKYKLKDGKKIVKETIHVAFSRIDEKEYEKIKDGKKVILTMEQCSSKLREELQALDLISGVIYHKYERNDDSLFNVIKPIVRRILETKTSEIHQK